MLLSLRKGRHDGGNHSQCLAKAHIISEDTAEDICWRRTFRAADDVPVSGKIFSSWVDSLD